MSRTHLFIVVVLLAAAAVAGLLALTRTSTAATPAASAQIAAKSRELDRLEAALRRSLAEQPPALPPAQPTVGHQATGTVFVRSSAALQSTTAEREDEEHEHEDEFEGADD